MVYTKLNPSISEKEIREISSLIQGFFVLPFIAFSIDRYIFIFYEYKGNTKNNFAQNQIIADKEEIIKIIKECTSTARRSIISFSGRMSWIERDMDYLKKIKAQKRNLCNVPTNKKEEYYLDLANDCDFENKFYPISDPLIRCRIIDAEIPNKTKVILISNDINSAGKKVYKAQIFDNSNGEVLITSLTKLFDVLWNLSNYEQEKEAK